ncbi:MAG: hypothetical protein L7F78_26285 [Syntrophales bacterium LBB04]|nr:hypothetical protein [Syntrophales bacterium LBB04]
MEKDRLVNGMLHEELARCRGMVSSLEQEISLLPKGSLHARKKQYKKKKYRYYYLKYREEGKSVSRHVPDRQLEAIKKELEKRTNYQKEIKVYKARIKYLEKIIGL